ncbi:beta-galactosidase-like [Phymastichus coffea]|uniref:beta-galactosidase-like n=1 Tax=Phymastichus coffea TaxID=108790 RepID=UPI00273C4C0E|nr:beta-galactosidase-like [Phymastichus coffea]
MLHNTNFLFLIAITLGYARNCTDNNVAVRTSFAIDYENDQFLLDGTPFRYVSGSFHYFRTPRQYWRDRLRKMRAAGLNAISTYVEWSLHQPELNKWVWDGDADLVEFIKQAQEEDLLVILRLGPYICAERDFGGFPYWLLSLVSDIKLRTNDSRYMEYAEKYLNQVLIRVKPLLRDNGGPIIMIQVENEYGHFYACDKHYTKRLRDIIKNHVKSDVVLFTTDGIYRPELRCGSIPGVYATIDFGTATNVTENFNLMREIEPKGPLVNSEFYTGWPSYWKGPFQRVETKKIIKMLDEMLSVGASVNFYMFYGGTNFAFTSGADVFDKYAPDITSYDYDAPLTEAGDLTPKYFQIRKTISQYLPLPNIPIPPVSLKGEYGIVQMKSVLRLFDNETRSLFGTKVINSQKALTFEALNVSSWLVLYEANVSSFDISNRSAILQASPKDRAFIYLDDELIGVLSRALKTKSLLLGPTNAKSLQILVENQGRVNFGNVDVEDFKGIFNVTLNDVKISPWNITGFRFNTIFESILTAIKSPTAEMKTLVSGPQILIGHFDVTGVPRDTYLNTAEWGKGAAFVNDRNLGRYWPLVGPQMTLYVPAAYLKEGKNTLVLVELEYVPANRKINFQTIPVLDYYSNRTSNR